MYYLLIPISKKNRNKNCFLFSQSKNKLENITFTMKLVENRWTLGFSAVTRQVKPPQAALRHSSV